MTERTVDATPVIQFDKNFYKIINHKWVQIPLSKRYQGYAYKSFDKSIFVCVDVKGIYALEEIQANEYKSQGLERWIQTARAQKALYPSIEPAM